jgi:hypothetical protein
MSSLSRFIQQWNHRVSLSPGAFRELLLSHHPDLPCFEDEVIRICGRRVCAGCLLAYPTALLVILLLRPSGMESVVLALLFAGISQLRRLTGNIIIQHGCRALAGIALGFGIGGAFWAVMQGRWIVLCVLVAGGVIYAMAKAWSFHAKLVACSLIEKPKSDDPGTGNWCSQE